MWFEALLLSKILDDSIDKSHEKMLAKLVVFASFHALQKHVQQSSCKNSIARNKIKYVCK